MKKSLGAKPILFPTPVLAIGTYTYSNLMDKRAFTVSIPSEEQLKEADYFGIVSGRQEDKFKATGLTPERAEYVDAPMVLVDFLERPSVLEEI